VRQVSSRRDARLQVAAQGDVGGASPQAAREIDHHAEVAAIPSVNHNTAKDGTTRPGADDDDLPNSPPPSSAWPTYYQLTDEIHPAAKQRNEHRREK